MEYNRALELSILKFLRVRIGQSFTPDELFEEIRKLAPATKESFLVTVRILQVEELIEVQTSSGDTVELVAITAITKEGLQLLRSKKH